MYKIKTHCYIFNVEVWMYLDRSWTYSTKMSKWKRRTWWCYNWQFLSTTCYLCSRCLLGFMLHHCCIGKWFTFFGNTNWILILHSFFYLALFPISNFPNGKRHSTPSLISTKFKKNHKIHWVHRMNRKIYMVSDTS